MLPAIAVIGAAWGDEGKGLMVDYLSDDNALVVRFNGGAQAGHTVVTPDGRRHVFSHVGAGALRGAPTFLSRHFIINPMLFAKEMGSLRRLIGDPDIGADPDAVVTTPWDMLINQAIEDARGDARHGSCGVGINETVTRCERGDPRLILRLSDLSNPGRVDMVAGYIRSVYLPIRLQELGIEFAPALAGFATHPALRENFVAGCRRLADHVTMATPRFYAAAMGAKQIVFEGAQGLALDEVRGEMPHVTRSRTGLTNVIGLMDEFGLTEARAVYVTRAYATRHGAGPLRTHEEGLVYEDTTNAAHAYQGTMRFGHLDADRLAADIRADIESHTNIDGSIALTHVDQVPYEIHARASDKTEKFTYHDLLRLLTEKAGLPVRYQSHGPTRKDVGKRRFAGAT